jgi:hypothetical protein
MPTSLDHSSKELMSRSAISLMLTARGLVVDWSATGQE